MKIDTPLNKGTKSMSINNSDHTKLQITQCIFYNVFLDKLTTLPANHVIGNFVFIFVAFLLLFFFYTILCGKKLTAYLVKSRHSTS